MPESLPATVMQYHRSGHRGSKTEEREKKIELHLKNAVFRKQRDLEHDPCDRVPRRQCANAGDVQNETASPRGVLFRAAVVSRMPSFFPLVLRWRG